MSTESSYTAMKLVDSHCHIDGEAYDSDRDDVVSRAHDNGVIAMLNIGTGDPAGGDFERAVAVGEKYENVFVSLGVHPHDAKLYDDAAEKHLTALAGSSGKVLSWGEIGLDFYYDHSPRDIQEQAFRRQLAAARRMDLPVIIHSRDADEETLRILTEECGHDGFRGGIMHCFGGTPTMAERLVELGFLISFAGNVTFKKAENLRDSARAVPIEKMLVETDCPFLTPVPHRGKRNEPAYAAHTAAFLAELKRVDVERFAEQTTESFLRFFRLEGRLAV